MKKVDATIASLFGTLIYIQNKDETSIEFGVKMPNDLVKHSNIPAPLGLKQAKEVRDALSMAIDWLESK
jgi:hypothetical protein